MKGALAALTASALPLWAETDFTRLTPAERAIFHNEIREMLLSVPQLLPRDLPKDMPEPAQIYAEEIESDLARIAAHEAHLFSGEPGFGPQGAAHRVALFTKAGCAECAAAEEDLRALARRHDLRVTLIDIAAHPELAKALQLDMAPSYVFPDRMLRGHIPPVVLERYLAQ